MGEGEKEGRKKERKGKEMEWKGKEGKGRVRKRKGGMEAGSGGVIREPPSYVQFAMSSSVYHKKGSACVGR